MRNRQTYSRLIQNVLPWSDFPKGRMIQFLHHCVEHDITSFDTSDQAGVAGVSNVFGTALSESGLSRDEIQLISKYGAPETDGDRLLEAVDKSLLDLETDYLDLLLLDYPHLTPEIANAVGRLQSQGKVMEVGGLNLEESQVRKFELPLGVNQIPSPFNTRNALDTIPTVVSAAEEIVHMVWCGEESHLTAGQEKLLQELGSQYKYNRDQLFLKWILQHPAHLHPILCASEKEAITAAVIMREKQLDPVDWQKIQLILT